MSGSNSEFSTAMDVVRAAADERISREELVSILLSWRYEPQYRTTGLADDWEFRDNSFEAVEYAFINGLIDENDYERIVRALDEDGPATKDSGGPRKPSACDSRLSSHVSEIDAEAIGDLLERLRVRGQPIL
ncbi:Asp-tRNAAsn/Glu-tRNAGln amidotransferase B subunit (PET112 homolog) [Microbacterium testaceum StLB037]|uniref:Asp-tRNAAsn/Glu-tRNAGln amidotransferase B subunit (PET112 homolog) n=1 Tax=Microbacterium testaceum (strain StLB037) TaxID=979556 RepID=E8NGG8_MICTS|nr:hypothetical protein [Microbacterium testaceum]BAJ74051.1 Asp-tRNAAsn/Glu-tRNAGln amidotransferase B subunit (PET112 homolog) [Microbacterium testaceum StLB037]